MAAFSRRKTRIAIPARNPVAIGCSCSEAWRFPTDHSYSLPPPVTTAIVVGPIRHRQLRRRSPEKKSARSQSVGAAQQVWRSKRIHRVPQ